MDFQYFAYSFFCSQNSNLERGGFLPFILSYGCATGKSRLNDMCNSFLSLPPNVFRPATVLAAFLFASWQPLTTLGEHLDFISSDSSASLNKSVIRTCQKANENERTR